jgi:hypothetical protein
MRFLTFYGDCVKIWEDFASNFGDKITGCCITTTHRLILAFSSGIFLPKTTLLCPQRLFSVSLIEGKTDRPTFWHNWESRQEPHRTRLHLQNGSRAGNGEYAQKGTTSRVKVASRPKVSFWPDGNISPDNYVCKRYEDILSAMFCQ